MEHGTHEEEMNDRDPSKKSSVYLSKESIMALGFAAAAHHKKKRKYTDEPYVIHAKAVGEIVARYDSRTEIVSAAFLHDVVEDTDVSIEYIREIFNDKVADLVMEVTGASKPEDGNRAVRKEIDRRHLAKSSPDGATIKLADMIHNTASIVKHDRDFARIYLLEKEMLLPFLSHGHPDLYLRAREVLRQAYLMLWIGE